MNSSGNVLFLILIAVALFAALSYAVSSTMRSGGGDSQAEQTSTQASVILSYAAGIRQSYDRIKIMNGCSAYDNPSEDSFAGNPATYPGKCNLFDSKDGGGSIYDTFPANSPIWSATPTQEGARVSFQSMWVRGIGSPDGAEAEMVIFNIKPEICKAINKILKIPADPSGEPPQEDSPYEGGFGGPRQSCCNDLFDNVTIGHAFGVDNALAGRGEGCYKAERAGVMGYHYYSVIDSY